MPLGINEYDAQTRQQLLDEVKPTFDVVERISSAMQDGVSEAQVCRTCDKTDTQRVIVPLTRMAAVRKANGGVLPPEAYCHPNVANEFRKIASDRTITPTSGRGTPVTLKTRAQKAAETVAFADTCGQRILEKCTTCTRFKRVVERVPGGVNASGRKYYIEVLIGGYCTIPEEGIVINGVTTFCDKIFMETDPLGLKQSCANCRYQTGHYGDIMLLHVTPLLGGLNVFEREMALLNASPDDNRGRLINNASRMRGKVRVKAGPHTKNTAMVWAGMTRFYRLLIERVHEDENERPIAVDLRIPGSGDIYTFSLTEGDDAVGLVNIVNKTYAVLQITTPHNRKYGLPDRNLVSFPQAEELVECPVCEGKKAYPDFSTGEWKDVPCGRCGATGQVSAGIAYDTEVRHHYPDRVDPKCTPCHGNVPCYHHMRLPRMKNDVGTLRLLNGVQEVVHSTNVIYETTQTKLVERIYNPANQVQLVRDGDKVTVLGMDGNPPSFTLMRIRMQSILSWCKNADERRQVHLQFARIKRTVSHAEGREVDYSWMFPAKVAPGHPYCAVNQYDQEHGFPTTTVRIGPFGEKSIEASPGQRGIDFEHEWNDAFGTPRDQLSTNRIMESFGSREIKLDPNFSWQLAQKHEEWLRVTSSGEAVQDEFVASLKQLRTGRRERGVSEESMVVDTSTMKVIKLGVGISNTNIQLESTEAVMDWLNTEIEIPGNDEARGFKATRRWVALGYEIFRNTKRLQEDDIAAVFDFNHHIGVGELEGAQENKIGYYACTRCFDPTAGGDAGMFFPDEVTTQDLTCPDPECDGILIFMPGEEYRAGHIQLGSMQIDADEPYRRMSGTADSDAWQRSQRLQQMSCPMWKPRNNRFIMT